MKLLEALRANPGKVVRSPQYNMGYQCAGPAQCITRQDGESGNPALKAYDYDDWEPLKAKREIDADEAIKLLREGKEIGRVNYPDTFRMSDGCIQYKTPKGGSWLPATYTTTLLLRGEGKYTVEE